MVSGNEMLNINWRLWLLAFACTSYFYSALFNLLQNLKQEKRVEKSNKNCSWKNPEDERNANLVSTQKGILFENEEK
jgi:hypothetical protein